MSKGLPRHCRFGCIPLTILLCRLRHPPLPPGRTPHSRHRATGFQRETAMNIRTILAASAAVLIGSVAAQAAEVAALTGDNTVSIVDTSKKAVTRTWKIDGVAGKVL